MKLKLNYLILFVLLFLTNVFIVNAQSLEMTSGASNPTGNGSSVSNQVITLQENTNDPSGNTFASFTPTTTVTYSFTNQQYTLPTSQMSTGTGMAFGTTQNTGGILAQPEGLFSLFSLFSVPSDGNFTSRPTGASGTGIDVDVNRGVRLFVSSRPLYNANSSRSGRYYYGDLVITFSRPVNDPMIHFVGLGGTSGGSTLGITSEYELSAASAAQMTLSEASGSTEFNVTSSKVLNSAATLGANTGAGAATGTVKVTGTNITSITFQVYMRSDNRSGGSWGGTNLHNGDSVLIGVSTEKPMSVSGNVFNDPDAGNVNNSSGTTNAVPTGMSANLIDSNNKVVASTSVATSGTYSFSGIFPGTYTTVLSTTAGTQGSTAPTASLPSGWSNAGEFNGTPNTGNDGTANGISAAFTVGTSNVTNINFGIRQAAPDLTLSKSHTGNFTVGSSGTYSFTVTNSGTAATSGTITVSDTLPTGLTVNGGALGSVTDGGTNAANWTCNSNAASPQVITCTSTTAIAANGTSVFNFAVNVGLGTAVGTNSITNTATVSGGGQTNTSNDSDTDPTTVLSPNLTIAKSHTGNFTRGSTGTYTITVSNSTGTAATSGTTTVTDTLPTGLSITNGTFTPSGTNGANWSCTAASNVITCTSTTAIAISGTSIFTLTVNVASNAASSVTNSVAVSGGNEATANNGNNSATDPTTTVAGAPSVALVKSCTSPANCTTAAQLPGTDITYQIQFTNTGGQNASGLRIVDGVPDNMDYKLSSATASVGTTGLTFTIEFSSDYDALNPTLATWTYTPLSTGGGASAGYDRLVKAVRWRVTSGSLPNTSPNNTGNVSFVAKIRQLKIVWSSNLVSGSDQIIFSNLVESLNLFGFPRFIFIEFFRHYFGNFRRNFNGNFGIEKQNPQAAG